MNKKMVIAGLLSLSGMAISFEVVALSVDYSLVQEIDRLESLQNSIDKTKDTPAFKESNDQNKEEIKKSCMSMGNWGRWLGDKLGADADRAKAYRICGQFEEFKKKHPRAYASIKPKQQAKTEEELKGSEPFKILGFSEPYTKYKDADFTAAGLLGGQYTRLKNMAKNNPDELKRIEVAYKILLDPVKRKQALKDYSDEEVEFTAE